MPSSFRVGYPGTVRTAIKAATKKAVEIGHGEEALAALAQIDRSLREDARTLGDPLFNLQTITFMHRVFPPWFVVYGVHHEQDVVFVQKIFPYPEFD